MMATPVNFSACRRRTHHCLQAEATYAAPPESLQHHASAEPVDVSLPPGSDDEETMDLTLTRKRCRDENSSDEDQTAPRKLPLSSPCPDSHDENTTESGTSALPTTTAPTPMAPQYPSHLVPTGPLPEEPNGPAALQDGSKATTTSRSTTTLTATQDPPATESDSKEEG